MQAQATGGVRFAPSPTGNFHIGNLRTAWISFKLAKDNKLPWVVRFEDIDFVRVVPGARAHQLSDMAKLGLKPDVEILQTEFRERHWDLFCKAIETKKIYPCDCSRKEVQTALNAMASAPHGPAATYSGRCRAADNRTLEAADSLAWRFKMDDPSGKDDFIVARSSKTVSANGLPIESTFVPGYHWACAIDDHDGAYDLLVRASDLKASLAPQRSIHQWLGRKKLIPVFHTSLVTKDDGHRLEKRTQGVTLDELLRSGITLENVIDGFEQSFKTINHSFSEDANLGEPNAVMTLSQLGIKLPG